MGIYCDCNKEREWRKSCMHPLITEIEVRKGLHHGVWAGNLVISYRPKDISCGAVWYGARWTYNWMRFLTHPTPSWSCLAHTVPGGSPVLNAPWGLASPWAHCTGARLDPIGGQWVAWQGRGIPWQGYRQYPWRIGPCLLMCQWRTWKRHVQSIYSAF
jgi:hypothetical protein